LKVNVNSSVQNGRGRRRIRRYNSGYLIHDFFPARQPHGTKAIVGICTLLLMS
jgi:hypothetical protein